MNLVKLFRTIAWTVIALAVLFVGYDFWFVKQLRRKRVAISGALADRLPADYQDSVEAIEEPEQSYIVSTNILGDATQRPTDPNFIDDLLGPEAKERQSEADRRRIEQLIAESDSKDERLAELENEARAKKLNIWSDEKPIPPWEWRKKKTE